MSDKRKVLVLLVLLLAVLACNFPGSQPTPPLSEPTVTPFVPQEVETAIPTVSTAPTESVLPTVSPTPEPSPTVTPTIAPAPTRTPVSAGPLDFPAPQPWDATWRALPDGSFEVTIVIPISGGAPPFIVHHDLDVFQTWERAYPLVFTARGCSALVHTITVESADGQSVSHDYYIPAPWCVTPSP